MSNDDFDGTLDLNERNDIDYGGQTWTTDELQRDFDVVGFTAPYVVVIRKSDGQKGSLQFTQSQHARLYFRFVAYKGDR